MDKTKHTLEIKGTVIPYFFMNIADGCDRWDVPTMGEYYNLIRDGWTKDFFNDNRFEIFPFMEVKQILVDGKEVDIEDIDVDFIPNFLRGWGVKEPFYCMMMEELDCSFTYEFYLPDNEKVNPELIQLGIMSDEIDGLIDKLIPTRVYYNGERLPYMEDYEWDFENTEVELWDFNRTNDDEWD
jgi:hypothetical protein